MNIETAARDAIRSVHIAAESTLPLLVKRIRANDRPHSDAAVAGRPIACRPCECVLCQLPRGPSWGEYELERRIAVMATEWVTALRGPDTWASGARTCLDRLGEYEAI